MGHKRLILSYPHIAVTCDHLPIQLLYGNAIVVAGSDSRPIEGQFITYTCPPGFILTGPNASVCMENREWEPDPGQVECIGNYNTVHKIIYVMIFMAKSIYSFHSFSCMHTCYHNDKLVLSFYNH